MHEVALRSATAADAVAISALISNLAEEFIVPDFSQAGRDFLLGAMTPQAIENYFGRGYRYHVAELSGELVGVVATRDNRHLYHFFVATALQGRGLGRRLWETALRACLDDGGGPEFTVAASRFALPIYQHFGFEISGSAQTKHEVVYIPMRLKLAPVGA